jgi:hypothetical protein
VIKKLHLAQYLLSLKHSTACLPPLPPPLYTHTYTQVSLLAFADFTEPLVMRVLSWCEAGTNKVGGGSQHTGLQRNAYSSSA